MQQINLYQPILRKQKKVFSASTLLLGNLIILLGLLLLYGYTMMQTRALQSQFDQATAQRNERQVKLQQLRLQYPTRQADAALPARLETARQRVRRQQTMYQAIQRYDDTPERRFSAQLQGLAQQVKSGMWLTDIQLQAGHMRLQGQTRDAERVPLLVQALNQEAAFAGMTFDEVIIAREETGNLLGFVMNTRRDPNAPRNAPSGAR